MKPDDPLDKIRSDRLRKRGLDKSGRKSAERLDGSVSQERQRQKRPGTPIVTGYANDRYQVQVGSDQRECDSMTNGAIRIGGNVVLKGRLIDQMRTVKRTTTTTTAVKTYYKIKYVYRILEVIDGVNTQIFYVGGHQQESIEVFRVPATIPVNVKITNLGGLNFLLDVVMPFDAASADEAAKFQRYENDVLVKESAAPKRHDFFEPFGHGFYQYVRQYALIDNIARYDRGYQVVSAVEGETGGASENNAAWITLTSPAALDNPGITTTTKDLQLYASPSRLIDSQTGSGEGSRFTPPGSTEFSDVAVEESYNEVQETALALNEGFTSGLIRGYRLVGSSTGLENNLNPAIATYIDNSYYQAYYKFYTSAGEATLDGITFAADLKGGFGEGQGFYVINRYDPYEYIGESFQGYTVPPDYVDPLDYRTKIDDPESDSFSYYPKFLDVFDNAFTAFYPAPIDDTLADDLSVQRASSRGDGIATYVVESWNEEIEKIGEVEANVFLPSTESAFFIYSMSYHPD